MRKFNFLSYILIMIILPIAIVSLCGNVVFRISETYIYHFNDSQVIEDIGSIVTGGEVADSITGYFNSPSRAEFQIYEQNGEFKDPIFDEVESRAMHKAKRVLTWTLLGGILLMAGGIALYIFMTGTVEREVLRLIGFITIGISAIELVVVDFLVARPGIRALLYDKFIGEALGEESTLRILLGSPIQKTYIIFSSVLSLAVMGIFLYIHSNITREKRLFS